MIKHLMQRQKKKAAKSKVDEEVTKHSIDQAVTNSDVIKQKIEELLL